MKNIHKIKDNIYITSDEDIKAGDYVVTKGNEVIQLNQSTCIFYSNKIILTTDRDLIKDGIQAIDDEFLEWFVKNPSCEFVEVEREKAIGYAGDRQRTFYGGYKIIIPKEEAKYILCGEANKFYRCVTCDAPCGSEGHYIEKPKQETLEEVAKKKYPMFKGETYIGNNKKMLRRAAFIKGAEWMQERMYSEDEVIAFGEFIFKHSLLTHTKGVKSLFEKFKK